MKGAFRAAESSTRAPGVPLSTAAAVAPPPTLATFEAAPASRRRAGRRAGGPDARDVPDGGGHRRDGPDRAYVRRRSQGHELPDGVDQPALRQRGQDLG